MIKPLPQTGLYLEAFLRLIYPAQCALCKSSLELEEKGVCTSCFASLQALCFPPEEAIDGQNFKFLGEAWALYPYRSPVKEILFGIKFLKKRWLLSLFEQPISRMALQMAGQASYDAVLPVPIHPSRLLEREFNQAALIAEKIAQASGVPLALHCLKKRFSTPSQNQLSREERKANLYKAFEVSAACEGKRFLLVDDIFTTGATAEEIARTLMERGARSVDLFTLARTESYS